MISSLFHTLVYDPLYNGLILLISSVSWLDMGMAVIVFTVIVRLILSPLSYLSVKGTVKTKMLAPQIEEIKKKYKDNRQKQAEETMKLYKDNDVRLGPGFLLVLIQIPIIFALYFIFRDGLTQVDTSILYSFIHAPETISPLFLGFFDVTAAKNIIISILVGVSQFVQMYFAMPSDKSGVKKERTFQNDMARYMQFQFKYVLPIVIAIVSYGFSAALSLYWITSNIFTTLQEIIIRKKIKREDRSKPAVTIMAQPNQ